ncbi:MAG: hypothetical protein JWR16_2891 [Nevskia sp.]|nr:hypothetical protein [Nevskia sp.]
MFKKARSAACVAVVLAVPLSGCYLATNGLDYSNQKVIVQAPPPAPVPPPPLPPPPPPCEMNSMGGCKTGDKVVLNGVNFDFDKSTLTLNAKALLDPVADSLKTTGATVEVDGHTDGIGSDAYNDRLSVNRAKSVKQYLTYKGVDSQRLAAKGFGKRVPIADNGTDEGRAINRRVELKVLDGGYVPPPVAAYSPAPAPPPPPEPEPLHPHVPMGPVGGLTGPIF